MKISSQLANMLGYSSAKGLKGRSARNGNQSAKSPIEHDYEDEDEDEKNQVGLRRCGR